MKVWIITTGSSDVQLNTKDRWISLFRNVKSQVDERGFTPTEGIDNRFLAPARVLGTVYSQTKAKEYWDDLAFPLLNNFVGQIQNQDINQIILILTDQRAVFSPEERRSQQSPYWQDTCALEPILETYLHSKFPKAELKPLLLQPKLPNEGLDDWDSVLTLIQGKFSKLTFPNESTIYVSHQAGTPAISSAVQFLSLTKFGQRVKFLVSSERDSNLTKVLDGGSTYLRGIRLQEAKILLERHDYSGVKELLAPYLKDEPEVKILLDAAIQWNFAKFDEFAKKLLQHSDGNFSKEVQERTKEENWWWTAYESAYLGVVRLKQGNTVEAMFHSFRAVEGLLRKWVEHHHSDKIYHGNRGKVIRVSDEQTFNLHGQDLYRFLEFCYDISKNDDIGIFGHHVFKKRNNLFHQLEGLQDKKAVFENWRSPNEKQWRDDAENKWKTRILKCLNFVSGETFEFLDKEDKNGKVANLMAIVHKKLESAIANYELTP